MGSTITESLAEQKVWDAESAFAALKLAGIAASRRTAERQLHRLGVWPDSLTADSLRDELNNTPDAELLAAELNQARTQRHLALFVQLVEISTGQTYLHANDARGARTWIELVALDPDAIKSALQLLQLHFAKPIVVFAHQVLGVLCSEIVALEHIEFAQFSSASTAIPIELPLSSSGSARPVTELDALESRAILRLRDLLDPAIISQFVVNASKEDAVLLHLLRKAFYPGVVPVIIAKPVADLSSHAQHYLTQLQMQYPAPEGVARTDVTGNLDSNEFLASWTEVQRWQYITREKIPVCSLYTAQRRAVIKRDGQWLLADSLRDRAPSEKLKIRSIRFKEVTTHPVAPGIESEAKTAGQVLAEVESAIPSIALSAPVKPPVESRADLTVAMKIHRLALPDQTPAAGARAVVVVQRVLEEPHRTILLGFTVSAPVSRADTLTCARTGQGVQVNEISTFDSATAQAQPGQAVAMTVQTDQSLRDGDLLFATGKALSQSDHLEATIFWLSETPGIAGRTLDLKLASQRSGAAITLIKHRIDPADGSRHAQRTMKLGGIYAGTVSTERTVAFDPSDTDGVLDRFELIDPDDQQVLAIGFVRHGLRRGTNLHQQLLTITRKDRERANHHTGRVVWFTGLSGSGKSTIANALEVALHRDGLHTYILDGDNVRLGLNKDLGFTDADRVENIRRIAEVARLMMDAGLIVMTAFISPFIREREMAKDLIGAENFFEVHVETPLEICEQRDIKGLYKKARRGDLPNMTGIDSPYEPPTNPSIRVSTENLDISLIVQQIREKIE